MSELTRDELGFVRARRYGRMDRTVLETVLQPQAGEQVYVTGVRAGVRTAEPVTTEAYPTRPGDTFTVGPRITKAACRRRPAPSTSVPATAARPNPPASRPASGHAAPLPEALRREVEALKRAGFGGVERPLASRIGWGVRLRGLTLPGGVRTDALVLLPNNYPLAGPIGFYVREGAATGALDTANLFDNLVAHGAPDLSARGWQWFCGIAEGWQPGRHTLVSYLTLVLALFNDRGAFA
jgi:hypothetical protein